MAICAQCGRTLPPDAVGCPACGGTVVPGRPHGNPGPLFAEGDRLADRFVVERLLGTGASGAVYSALDTLMGVPVALKVMWDSAVPGEEAFERFRREVQAAQTVGDARHLVAIHHILLLEDGRPALAMERVEGGSLKDLIQQEGPLPWARAVDLAAQIAEGLAQLHAHGIVHRDVKSGNVLIGPGFTAKLGDFGLVKGEILGATLTQAGSALGTPGYMAPEAIRGMESTPASDLYSLGVVLYEMLTGQTPFQGQSGLEVASKHLADAPPLPPLKAAGTPRWLSRAVRRLLEKDPRDRFSSASDVARALRNRSPGLGWSRRWTRRAVAAGVIAALALGAAGIAWKMSRPSVLALSFRGKVLEARSPSGQLQWKKELPAEVRSACFGLFGPEGSPAVACALGAAPSAAPGTRAPDPIYLWDRNGALIRTLPAALSGTASSAAYAITVSAHRFRAGAPDRLVVYLRQWAWYPTGLKVLDTAGERESTRVVRPFESLDVYNSGLFYDWAYKDLDGDGVDDVVYAGSNYRLFDVLFVAAAKLVRSRTASDRTTHSPDLAQTSTNPPLFYRCFAFGQVSKLKVEGGHAGPIKLSLPGQPPWTLTGRGELVQDGLSQGPDLGHIAAADALLPDLCYLKDQGRWQDILKLVSQWPHGLAYPYNWLGRFFSVQALMGLGRHQEAQDLLARSAKEFTGHDLPLPYYEFELSSLFLEGRYRPCLDRFFSLPPEVRMTMPELGRTAVWAALYLGDEEALRRLQRDSGVSKYMWFPELFTGVWDYVRGDFAAAQAGFGSLRLQCAYDPEPSLWLADALARQGRVAQADAILKSLQPDEYSEPPQDTDVGLWLRWKGGDHGSDLLEKMDALVQTKRLEAQTDAETRALLPLLLWRAADMKAESGETAAAGRLLAEAKATAPASWQGCLRR